MTVFGVSMLCSGSGTAVTAITVMWGQLDCLITLMSIGEQMPEDDLTNKETKCSVS